METRITRGSDDQIVNKVAVCQARLVDVLQNAQLDAIVIVASDLSLFSCCIHE